MAVGYVSRQSKSHHIMSDLHVYQRGRVDFKRDLTFMSSPKSLINTQLVEQPSLLDFSILLFH